MGLLTWMESVGGEREKCQLRSDLQKESFEDRMQIPACDTLLLRAPLPLWILLKPCLCLFRPPQAFTRSVSSAWKASSPTNSYLSSGP